MHIPDNPPEYRDINGIEAIINDLPPGKPKLALTIAQLVMQAIEKSDEKPKKKRGQTQPRIRGGVV